MLAPMVGTPDTKLPNVTKIDAPDKCVSCPGREAYFLETVIITTSASSTFQLRSFSESRYQSDIMLPTNGFNNMNYFHAKM